MASVKKNGKKLIWIVLGQGFSLLHTPDIYSHVDVIIYLDCNKHVLDCIKYQYEVFPIADDINDFYARFLRNFTTSENISKDGLYIGANTTKYESLNKAIVEHKAIFAKEHYSKYKYGQSSKRFKRCQSAVRENAKKTIFLNMDIYNMEALEKLNQILSAKNYMLVGITLTNIATWLSNNYFINRAATYDKLGILLHDKLPVVKNAMIISSIRYTTNLTFLSNTPEIYWRNHMKNETLKMMKEIFSLPKSNGQERLNLLNTNIYEITEIKKDNPSVIDIIFKVVDCSEKNININNPNSLSSPKTQSKYIQAGDTIFHLIARITKEIAEDDDQVLPLKIRLLPFKIFLEILLKFLQYEQSFDRNVSFSSIKNANGENPLQIVNNIRTNNVISNMFKNYEESLRVKKTIKEPQMFSQTEIEVNPQKFVRHLN